MTSAPGYTSPAAFRQALTDRLRAQAANGSRALAQLQRQFAYDRLLARLYHADDRWVVKGATALLARQIGGRGTLDIDLYLDEAHQDAALELRRAAASDLGDWFRFEVGAARPSAAETAGLRMPVAAFIGNTRWAAFSVDVFGGDLRMTGVPERVAPLVRVELANIQQTGYRVYPLVDHIADKIVATFQRYGASQTLPPASRTSSTWSPSRAPPRLTLRRNGSPCARKLPGAMSYCPKRLAFPTLGSGSRATRRQQPEAKLTATPTVEAAVAAIRPFADPLLDGTASGRWEPEPRTWASG